MFDLAITVISTAVTAVRVARSQARGNQEATVSGGMCVGWELNPGTMHPRLVSTEPQPQPVGF